nr:SoxR reducing system RseC family protein [bacterium]
GRGMTEQAIVVAVRQDEVEISLQRTSACGKCGLCMAHEGGVMRAWVKNACGATVGQRVRLELSSANALRATWMVYGVPLGLMVALAAAGYGLALALSLPQPDAWAGGGAVAGVALGWMIAHVYDKKRSPGLVPTAVEILPDEEDASPCALGDETRDAGRKDPSL